MALSIRKAFLLVILAPLALAGCASSPDWKTCALSGAVLGGLAGGQEDGGTAALAAAGGAALGGSLCYFFGDQDSDGDGVLDSVDECPDTRPGAEVDEVGCEIIARLSGEAGVNFEFDSSDLTVAAMATLDNVAAEILSHPEENIDVIGHTDSSGPAEYNQGLSERRANSVVDHLISKGVRADLLEAIGMGETQPIATNSTPEGRAENRRVLIKVSND